MTDTSPGEGMTDRELLIEIWEIACAGEAVSRELLAEVQGLRARVNQLEEEFLPAARRYQKLTRPLARANHNGRTHGPQG